MYERTLGCLLNDYELSLYIVVYRTIFRIYIFALMLSGNDDLNFSFISILQKSNLNNNVFMLMRLVRFSGFTLIINTQTGNLRLV